MAPMMKFMFWLEIAVVVTAIFLAVTHMDDPDVSRKHALVALGASIYTYWRVRVFGPPE